jgi:hypothetical protein
MQQLDRLLDPGPAAEEDILTVLRSQHHRDRLIHFISDDPAARYYKPPSEASAAEWEAFEKGQRKLQLLPGWREVGVGELPGGAEERAGVKALSSFLQLEEAAALQVLHHFQKDRYRRGLDMELDRRDYASPAFFEGVRRFYHNQRVYLLKTLQELVRIDQDSTYPRRRLREAVAGVIDKLDQPTGSLGQKLVVSGVVHGCMGTWTCSPPRVDRRATPLMPMRMDSLLAPMCVVCACRRWCVRCIRRLCLGWRS